MPGRGVYAAANAAKRTNTWGLLTEDSILVQPSRILGQEAEAFGHVADAQISAAYSHLTRPYTARAWYKYPADGVNGASYNSGVQLTGDGKTLRETTTLLDFKEAPPTSYEHTADWVEALDLSALTGLSILDFHYVRNLQTALTDEGQDAIVLLAAGTGTLDPAYHIYYEDGTTHNIRIPSRRNNFESLGSDERVNEVDFSYTPIRTLDPRIDNAKLLDLFRSDSHESYDQSIAQFTSAELPVPGAITGEVVKLSEVVHIDDGFPTGTSNPLGGIADWSWSDEGSNPPGYFFVAGGRAVYRETINQPTIVYMYHDDPIAAVTGVPITIDFDLQGEQLADQNPSTSNEPRIEMYFATELPTPTVPTALLATVEETTSEGYDSWVANKFTIVNNADTHYTVTFTPTETSECYLIFRMTKTISNISANVTMFLDDILVNAIIPPVPSIVTVPSTAFTFNTITIPGAGRLENEHCWVDSTALLHVKFDTTELTAQLTSTSISYNVTATYDGITLSLYVNGVLRNATAYVSSGDLDLTSIAQWGSTSGIVGPTSYWNKAWTPAEVLFTNAYPGILPIHSLGSQLTESDILANFTFQERSGQTLHDVATGTNNIDLSNWTFTWTESDLLPSFANYSYIKHGLGVYAAQVIPLPDILQDTMTVEVNFSGVAANGTILHLYGDADNELKLISSTAGANMHLSHKADGTTVVTPVLGVTAGTAYTARIRKAAGTLYLTIGVATRSNAVGNFRASAAEIHYGADKTGADSVSGEHSINLVAIAPGINWTKPIKDDASKRPAAFTQQWANDVYKGELRNLVNNSYHLTVASQDAFSYIPAVNTGYWTYAVPITNSPAAFYHTPYLIDGDLFPVYPGNVWAMQYDYLPVKSPAAFSPKRSGHGYRQKTGDVFENVTTILNTADGNTAKLYYRQLSRLRIEIEDPRIQTGTQCVIEIEGTKVSTVEWTDSSADFTDKIVDANLSKLTADMVKVYKASAPVEATVTVDDKSIHITAIDDGVLSVVISYRSTSAATKTAVRADGSFAVIQLAAADYSAYPSSRGVTVTGVTLETAFTYSMPTSSPQEHYIDEAFSNVYGQVGTNGTDTHLVFMHAPDGEVAYTRIHIEDTPISTRYFYHHWAILSSNNSIACYSASNPGKRKWSYALPVRPTASYVPHSFEFTPQNDMYVLYSDGTDFELKSFTPRYDYAIVFQEPDTDDTDKIKLTIFTRYEYAQLQIDLDGTPETTKGYLLYAEGPELI